MESEDLIISQGFFINLFQKNTNGMVVSESLRSVSSLSGIEYHLAKKIFTNSDNISFTEIDTKTIVATQILNNAIDFYDLNNYSVIKRVDKIEFGYKKNIMCLIKNKVLTKYIDPLLPPIAKVSLFIKHIQFFTLLNSILFILLTIE